jgi:hypothetical protein
MRGEYLESLLSVPEMRSKATKSLIKAAVKFLSYSDEKKHSMEVKACERKGVQDTHLEIVASVRLKKGKADAWSANVKWYGRKWYFFVKKEVDNNRSSVGLFLHCSPDTHRSFADSTEVVNYDFYVRTWPSGFWKLLYEGSESLKIFDEFGSGTTDLLDMPWEEARQSTKYIGNTGEMTIKVVARRLKSEDYKARGGVAKP